MINISTAKSILGKKKMLKEELNNVEYKKHFQLAIINLEQNLIEERIPELKRTA
jgi:hypothetical protein